MPRYVAASTMPPPGMPGAPMFSSRETSSIHSSMPRETVCPLMCMTYMPSRQKDTAPPHICIVQPRGATMPLILSDVSNPSRQVRMVSGRVAAEEQVEMAVRNSRAVF